MKWRMTTSEYREIITALGLSQVATAHFLEVDGRTSRRWACGESEIPPAVTLILHYLIGSGIMPEEITETVKEFRMQLGDGGGV